MLLAAEAALSRERERRVVLVSQWWTRYRRAVVDSLHGLAERCGLPLAVARRAGPDARGSRSLHLGSRSRDTGMVSSKLLLRS